MARPAIKSKVDIEGMVCDDLHCIVSSGYCPLVSSCEHGNDFWVLLGMETF
jgi:hypothetical protein